MHLALHSAKVARIWFIKIFFTYSARVTRDHLPEPHRTSISPLINSNFRLPLEYEQNVGMSTGVIWPRNGIQYQVDVSTAKTERILDDLLKECGADFQLFS